jgi:DNA-binding IclR family transcriptional regulator
VESNPEDTSSDRPVALIGAVDNVLRMLRLFEDHEMIRVNQVARDLGLSRSTVHRMLATLSHHRYVEQDAQSRAYKPGPALVDIGLGVVSKIDIRAKARSALLRLRDLTQETAHLGTMRGPDSVIFLDSIESERVVRTGSRIGRILPAHATATGKVLLRSCWRSLPKSVASGTASTTAKARRMSPPSPRRSATREAPLASPSWLLHRRRAPTRRGRRLRPPRS